MHIHYPLHDENYDRSSVLIMEVQMDALLDTAPCGFLSCSEDGTILQVNQTLATWLDYEPHYLENQSLNLLLSTDTRVFCQTHFFPMLRLQGYVEEFYFSLQSKPGEAIAMLVNSQRHERAGKTVYDCAFMRTVRRDQYQNKILFAQRQAQASGQAKADILAVLSHEFRTPLNAMLGFAEMLEMEMEGQLTTAQKEYIAAIYSSSEDILHLTSTILEFAQLAIGHIKFNLQPIQVPEVLKQVEVLMAPTLSSCGIHYANEPSVNQPSVNQPSDHLSPVSSNSVQLQRIIINLLENALKFTEPGGSVFVACSQMDDKVQIHISDTGCGIPKEYFPLIFEPFVRVHHLQNEGSTQGIGLGLAISRHLARAMGGDITVISVLGNGSTFTISLPKCEP